MSKITTDDCRKFLVEEIYRNPSIITEIFNGDTSVLKHALKEKNWSRERKFDANGKSDYADIGYQVWSPMYAKKIPECIPAVSLKCVRMLDLKGYDGQVAFYILENNSGNLILGQYVGD